MRITLSSDEGKILLGILNLYRADKAIEQIYFEVLCALVEQTGEETVEIYAEDSINKA